VAGTLTELPPVDIAGHKASGLGNEDHPMRVMTRRAAGLQTPGWDAEARAEVAGLFDSLAPEWHTRTSPERAAVVADALERGLAGRTAGEVCVELGAGIGAYTPVLGERWPTVIATDIAIEMLHRGPSSAGHQVLADSARLPLRDGAADAFVLVNTFLFPTEVDRVLGPDGVLIWVNSSGVQTPIYLPAADVVAALPGRWEGVSSGAGEGTWCVMSRARR
jgi:Methylase involved in ubiquinone/menaquinone biosynthesis